MASQMDLPPLSEAMRARRSRMLDQIRLVTSDTRIVNVMARVRRDLFVPDAIREAAYEDRALPIGFDQTISQPQIVASMTAAVIPGPDDTVLDVGTGSGYQAAVLAHLVRRVISVERIPELAYQARERLRRLGYSNVTVKVAGSKLGAPENAPFDGIIVAAGAPRIPRTLAGQLREGGRLVIPVGRLDAQYLTRVTRRAADRFQIEQLELCQFVPLIGEEAWSEESRQTES